jgi:hypothetical protein
MAMSRDITVASATASTTQTQAGGTVLNADFTIATVANASDAFTIPANLPKGTIFFVVGGANAGLIFPPVGGSINGGTVDASKPLDVTVVTMIVVTASGSASTYRANKLAALSA